LFNHKVSGMRIKQPVMLIGVFILCFARVEAQEGLDLNPNPKSDSIRLMVFTDPYWAVFSLNDNKLHRQKTWITLKKGIYPIHIRARYHEPLFDTLDLNVDKNVIGFDYKLKMLPEARILTSRMLLSSIPIYLSASIGFRQALWLSAETLELEEMALQLETSANIEGLEEQFASRQRAFKANRAVLGVSGMIFAVSAVNIVLLRQTRRALREDVYRKDKIGYFQAKPFYDYNTGSCGTSLVYSF